MDLCIPFTVPAYYQQTADHRMGTLGLILQTEKLRLKASIHRDTGCD